MNSDTFKGLSKLIGEKYANVARNNRNSFSRKLQTLFENKRIPDFGFSDLEIKMLLNELSNMDCNNSSKLTGMGEREGRVYSEIVKQRHYGFSHGIGRSGDIAALQPKAPGSSIINQLTNSLLLHLVRERGLIKAKGAALFPVATGMALTICMLLLRKRRPLAKYVIWSRIDQKSCFKSILTAGYEPIIVELIQVGDELQTDVAKIESIINDKGVDQIACVMSTTSCFAPRVPDNIVAITKLCHQHNLPHLVNNAYGLMISRCINVLQEAFSKYPHTIFCIVQSTDKNLMVPVGGAIVVTSNKATIDELTSLYPGRASATPSIDTFITLLSMGLSGIRQLVQEQMGNFIYLKQQIKLKITDKYEIAAMTTDHNHISLAIDLTPLELTDNTPVTLLGSQLFHRSISGARIVESHKSNGAVKNIDGYDFYGFGSHSSVSTRDYLNVAAAIGQDRDEIDRFVSVFSGLLDQYIKPNQIVNGDNVNSVDK